jgi:hypothetical protein
MIANSIHVATWDSFTQFGVPVLFFLHQLAPDNKIYISPGNGLGYINIINSPDSLGIACNFQPHSLELPEFTYTFNIPSFPNYDLGALPGGDSCNAVYTHHNIQLKSSVSFRVSPNPVSDWLNIIYNTPDDALLELYDSYGKRMKAITLFPYFKNRLVNVSDLPSGIYLATVTRKGKNIWSEKVIVAH